MVENGCFLTYHNLRARHQSHQELEHIDLVDSVYCNATSLVGVVHLQKTSKNYHYNIISERVRSSAWFLSKNLEILQKARFQMGRKISTF